jgi:hypothetical protein
MEGLGRVTLEAMLSGITVIGADTGGTKEIIGEDLERGYLYRQGNAEDLAQKIELVIHSKEEREAKRKEAQTYIQTLTNPNIYALKVFKAYEKANNEFNNKKHARDIVFNQIARINTESLYIENNVQAYSTDIKYDEFKVMFFTAEKWLGIKQKKKTITDYLVSQGFKTAAIYGMEYLGCDLYDDIDKSQIKISYVIDKAQMNIDQWLTFLQPSDYLPCVDIIIVTDVGLACLVTESQITLGRRALLFRCEGVPFDGLLVILRHDLASFSPGSTSSAAAV